MKSQPLGYHAKSSSLLKDFLVVIPQNIVIRRRHQEGGGGVSTERRVGCFHFQSSHLAILPWDMRMGTDGSSD